MPTEAKTTAAARTPAPPAEPKRDPLIQDLLDAATTPQQRAHAFELARVVEQAQMVRRAAHLVAATEWGAALTTERRAAFSRYCLAIGADPTRHVDILGGAPFINGDYYRDVIAADEKFDWAEPLEWLHDDPRLAACALCGLPYDADVSHKHSKEEVTASNQARLVERLRRASRRLEENATEDSPAVCVLRLRFKGRSEAIYGIGEVHPGRLKASQNKPERDRDPIGMQSPRATAETRAWREAGEKVQPVWFRTHTPLIKRLEAGMVDAYESERSAGTLELPPGPVPPPLADADGVVVEPMPGLASGAVEADVEPPKQPTLVKHNPNARCKKEGPHPEAECALVPKETA
jgi:hypothetical protein